MAATTGSRTARSPAGKASGVQKQLMDKVSRRLKNGTVASGADAVIMVVGRPRLNAEHFLHRRLGGA